MDAASVPGPAVLVRIAVTLPCLNHQSGQMPLSLFSRNRSDAVKFDVWASARHTNAICAVTPQQAL